MNKHSDIVQQTIDKSKQISRDMRKAYEKKQKELAKKKKIKPSSVVDDFIKDHTKELTPAEKAKRTKAKNKAKKLIAEQTKRDKEALAKYQLRKVEKHKRIQEALNGSSKSSIH